MDQELRNIILENFNKLGLNSDLSVVYLELLQNGSKSVVQLSRQLSLGRNIIYRILEELKSLNLVNQVKELNSSKYEALSYDNLNLIVQSKSKEYQKAQEGFNVLLNELPHLQSVNTVSSKVIHYHGIDGLKQVNWNLVHTKDMYRTYEVSRLTDYLDEDFAENLRAEWLRRKIYARDLTNDTKITAHTNISDFIMNYSEYRYIDPKILKIEIEVYIYNDVISVLQYDDMKYDPSSIFCVEIHNVALANFQRKIYDILWNQAKTFKKIGNRGEMELK